ncbi:MAG TPA: CBS domain-containing protein [Kofleriaceae bacterium]|nr:CBS domain-containing protein [Kofleriaceae bacterium]
MAHSPVLYARDVMQPDVITVTPETRILDLHRLFVEEEIHGAPVVRGDGVVIGVVSALDLLRIVRDEIEPGAGSTATTYFRDELPYSGPDWLAMPEDFQDRMQELTAADAMTRELVMVGPDALLDAVVDTMLTQKVHRVLVGEHGVLEGLITAFDLLHVLARVLPPVPQAGTTRYTGYRGDVTRP